MKTRAEVEKLKRDWVNDGCWDLEDSEGFEEYREELIQFVKYQNTVNLLRRKLRRLLRRIQKHNRRLFRMDYERVEIENAIKFLYDLNEFKVKHVQE